MYYFTARSKPVQPNYRFSFLKFKKRTPVIRVNETKVNTEKTSKRDNFDSEVNKESNCDERDLFGVTMNNFDWHFEPQTTGNIDIRF